MINVYFLKIVAKLRLVATRYILLLLLLLTINLQTKYNDL